MFKKYLRCFIVSFLLALVIPLISVDFYLPVEGEGLASDMVVVIEGKEEIIHETKNGSLVDKLQFYFTSTEAFLYYLRMVFPWFLVMFLASVLSTLLNSRANKKN